jgi:hypothetical protein
MPIPVLPDVGDLGGTGTPGAVLHDGQLVLGDIMLGTTDELGVEWILESLTGWDDSVESTGETEQRASDHGGWNSPAYYASRLVEIEGSLLASSWPAATAALTRLMGAIPLSTPDTLYVADSDALVLQADVRQSGDPLVTRKGGWARFSLSLIAADPRRYSTGWTEAYTGLPTTSGGLSLPLTLPLSVGAVSTNGTLQAFNAGNMATRPTFTVQGPCPAFTITHLGSGKSLRFAEAIAAGRSLVIDTDKRLALLDGTARRVVSGTWFDYEPGNNEVSFSAATYDSAALLVSSHRSAWR